MHYTGTLGFPGGNTDVTAGGGYPALSQGEPGTAAFFDESGAGLHVLVFTHFTFPAGVPGSIGDLTLKGGITRL